MTCVCVCVRQRASDLAEMITRVIREGLEGLVLKDIKVHCILFVWMEMEKCLNITVICACLQGGYEPGKRHWLKVKKDYLNEGAMADTADLVVLGAFYGKGSNGEKEKNPSLKYLRLCTVDLLEKSFVLTVLAWLTFISLQGSQNSFGSHTGQTSTSPWGRLVLALQTCRRSNKT